MRILYIEDDCSKKTAVGRALKSSGWGYPDTKGNLKEALCEVEDASDRGEPYDVVLTDMSYPLKPGDVEEGHAGEELIRELRERGYRIPVVIISSVQYRVQDAYATIWYSTNNLWDQQLNQTLATIEARERM